MRKTEKTREQIGDELAREMFQAFPNVTILIVVVLVMLAQGNQR